MKKTNRSYAESSRLRKSLGGVARKLVRGIGRRGLSGLIGAALATLLGVLCLDPGLLFLPANFSQNVLRSSYDLLFPIRGVKPVPQEDVVVLYLDDESFKELNQGHFEPWNRRHFTRLLEILKRDRAKAVVFDIVFSDLLRDAEVDQEFSKALKSFTNYVVAADWTTPEPGKKLRSVSPPNDLFYDTAEQLGLSEMRPDDDFVPREMFLGAESEQVYTLSWAAARMAGLPSVRGKEMEHAQRWINYYGPPGIIPFISFHKVIQDKEGTPPPGFFAGKVVFVGERIVTFRPGQRKDEYVSPYSYWSSTSKFMPGVEIHATQYLNLLRGDWLNRLPKAYEGTLIVTMGILLGLSLSSMRPLGATFVALSAAGAVLALAYLMFVRIQVWFPWLVIVKVQIPAAWAWSLVYNSVTLYVEKRLMQQSVAMYVSPKRAAQIAQGHEDMLKPGAHEQEVSILFSDIANFTSMSADLSSDELARLMNNYFDKALENGLDPTDGTVVKFIGDAIFAVWNAPEKQPNHHELACRGAILLRNEASAFEEIKVKKPGLDVRTRIGLHCGVANVGNFGGKRRVDYTMFGANINLASRMEGLNKYLGTDVLITGDIESKVRGKFVTRYAGRFQLKGFDRAVDVHELLELAEKAGESKEWRDAFEQARQHFVRKEFDQAEAGLIKVLELKPQDGPSKFLLKQIAELRETPPSESWQGDIELKEK